jgi:FKBP-type peptidyl-prolyl cis-trans isomerase
LRIIEVRRGAGAEAKSGMTLKVTYRGTLKDGKEFDRNSDTTRPFSFVLGAGLVIKGWEEGLLGMKVGGKRKLVIPSELAYGKRGGGPIPPDAELTFEVELLAAK